ncbi:hypothetical protein ACFLSW_04935 [Candidatus Bipolaricaulota bacterium]
MKGQCALGLAILILLGASWMLCAERIESVPVRFLAALPILDRGMTQITLSNTPAGSTLSVNRSIASHILVRGTAGTSTPLDLSVRLLAPLELAPVFLAVELAPTRVTGLMTLFFGPVSIDLGRTWFEPARWALVQLVVHPRLTWVMGGVQESERIVPQVGWRLFPTGSARWEVGMMFARERVCLSFGAML